MISYRSLLLSTIVLNDESPNHKIYWVHRQFPISVVPRHPTNLVWTFQLGQTIFGELDTYAVGIQPEGQRSGSPPCWCVTYQTSLSLCRCRAGSVYQGHGQEWQLYVHRSLKYFGWLPAGSRSSSPDYLK